MMRLALLVMALFSSFQARGADVKRYLILKGRDYFQAGTAGPAIQTNNAYRFTASVYVSTNGGVSSATLIPPTGAGRNLLPDLDASPLRVRERFDDSAELERFFPNGGYLLSIKTVHDGTRTMAHSISGNVYPNAPRVANFAAVQAIPYNHYSEIVWQPFVGGTTNDFIQAKIEKINGDTVFESPDFGEPGALNGLATRALLEPGDLTSGVTYYGQIQFVRVLQNGGEAYPGVPGSVGYSARTEFTVKCVPTSISPKVDRIQLWQVHQLSQSPEAPPITDLSGWAFRGSVEATSESALSNVTMITPAPALTNSLTTNSIEFDFADDFATRSELQSRYRAGNYNVIATRPNGVSEQFTISFPTNDFPPVPTINVPMEAVDSDSDFVVTWDRWTNASELDFIRVEISDLLGQEIYQTPGFTSSKHLRGDATSAVIPWTILLPGRTYRVDVTFRKVTVLDTREVPGGLVLGGYARRTRFHFSTIPSDVAGFGISLSRYRWQRGEDVFTSDPFPYLFEAEATALASNYVQSAALSIPNNGILTLPPITNGFGRAFKLTAPSDGTVALSQYPTGLYTFRFETLNDGFKTSTVSLASKELPPFPKARFFSTLGTVPAGEGSYALAWEPWIGARVGKDVVRIIITDWSGAVKKDTGPLGAAEAQAGTNTAFGIIQLLKANDTYTVSLRFETTEEFPSAAYRGATGRTTLFSETRFYMSTLGTDRLRNQPFRAFDLTLMEENLRYAIRPALSNRLYRIDLMVGEKTWIPVQTNLSPQDGSDFILTIPRGSSGGLYRTVVLP